MDDFLNLKKIQEKLAAKKWNLYDYQKEFLELQLSKKFRQFLITSEIGTGKTITAFLPFFKSALDKVTKKVIYVSPLKSINTTLHERLIELSRYFGIKCKIEKRTSDISYTKKKKQLFKIPDILLTTPESLTLMIANPYAASLLQDTDYLIIDELNEFINSKRGDQLALTLTRINNINQKFEIFGISGTTSNKSYLVEWLSFNGKTKLIKNHVRKKVKIKVVCSENIPTSGHSSFCSLSLIKKIISNKRSIIFVNTRAQAEILFKNLFLLFNDNQKLGLHHGSLSKEHRKKTEEQFIKEKINTIICTSSLELGIDFKNIDQVINIGTPKSINRLIQRTGRSHHYFFGIPTSYLIPTNKFEFLECIASKKLAEKSEFDYIESRYGSKDVLCQHLMLLSCNEGVNPIETFNEIKKSYLYSKLDYKVFLDIIKFIKDGGYVLNNYKKWNKLNVHENGILKINSVKNRIKTLINIGTIIDNSNLKIRLKSGKILGFVDESFVLSIKCGEVFTFSGLNLMCTSINSEEIFVDIVKRKSQKTPIYWGGNLPLNPKISEEIFNTFINKKYYPLEIKEFIIKQKKESSIPKKNKILIENFSYKNGQYLCIFTFMGKQTNQTLSELLINYLKTEYNVITSDYSLNEYSLAIFINKKMNFEPKNLSSFFAQKNKKIDFLKTSIAKKIFREITLITGLIDKKSMNKKNFVNSDIIFDTLFKYQPNHILLKITKEEIGRYFSAMTQIDYLFKKKITFNKIPNPSPFSKTLIYQKEKNKMTVHNPDNLFEFFNN
ncbi:MAG: hypothetical protein CL572_01695 [Alphaproteobacteria bacterium]|nr:hypothetical protein [Alphaproteobacteria bacterium]